jgi:glucosamine--fructose-6-phosphate aminotransferase (isomerizing)
MCGIIGYVGEHSAGSIVTQGLSNLDYRGYDSAGVALVDSEVVIDKRSGEVSNLEVPDSDATTGIGHTRWSTHGPPTDINAHPHTDCTGEIAVVHNGIIENYDVLKSKLSSHTFESDTDTEVIPHLLEAELKSDTSLREAVQAVVAQLEGSYAICVSVKSRDEIVVARDGSPLVVGYGDGENFVGSDVTAFLEHTQTVTYLEDGDVARVDDGDIEVWNGNQKVERDVERVEWEAEAAEKGGYEHFMRKEIHEQPTALRQTLSGRIDISAATADLDLEFEEAFLESIEEIQFVACGTSYYAALYAAELLERFGDVRTSVTIASEYRFGGGRDPYCTLTVAVTQSGETADTLRAIRRAEAAGARTMAVTNTLGSTVTREVDETLFIRAGPEIGVAATKTFASQVTTLALFSVFLGRARGGISAAKARDVLEDLQRVPGAIQQALDREREVIDAAEKYEDSRSFFFVGRSLGVPVALEGALKLKEISYAHAEGFAAGELKHGPLALVTPETPVLGVLTEGANPAETMNNVTEAQTRGADALGCVSSDTRFRTLDVSFSVPDVGVTEPLVANVYLQLFAYHVANLQDRPIDKPRNLAKSVTVE